MKRRPGTFVGFVVRRALVAVVVAVATISLFADMATAQEDPYNPDPPSVSVADPEVCGGESVVTTVSDAQPGETVTVTFAGQTQTVTVGADGTASLAFPTDGVAPGAYDIVATSAAGPSASAPATVLSPDDPACREDPPPGPTVSVADPSVCGGEAVVVTISSAQPGDTVTVSFAGQSSTVTVGAGGTASAAFGTDGIAPGTYEIVASASSGGSASTSATVLSAEDQTCQPPSGPPLSVTGSDVCVGDSVVASVGGASPGENVTLSVAGIDITVASGADGAVQASIPTSGVTPGSYDLLAVSSSGGGASTQVSVLASIVERCTDPDALGSSVSAGSDSSGRDLGDLASTGATIALPVAMGAALVAAGLVLVRRARRSGSAATRRT